jgi:hypothetical protein
MDSLESSASWQPDPDTRELLVALLEALSIPAPATKGDRAAYCGVLADRATCARLTLGGLLADRPGINLAWEVSHLRQQLADHLPTYQHAPPSDPTAKAGDPRGVPNGQAEQHRGGPPAELDVRCWSPPAHLDEDGAGITPPS